MVLFSTNRDEEEVYTAVGDGLRPLVFYSFSLLSVRITLSTIAMEKLIAKASQLGWSKEPINLEVEPTVEVKSKLILLGKVFLSKIFFRTVVVKITAKA